MILVEHGTLVTVDPERRIFVDGSVLVDGRDIVQVGRAADVRPPRPPDRVIDARRRVVLPGFVDTHVHLSEHVNRGLLLDDTGHRLPRGRQAGRPRPLRRRHAGMAATPEPAEQPGLRGDRRQRTDRARRCPGRPPDRDEVAGHPVIAGGRPRALDTGSRPGL